MEPIKTFVYSLMIVLMTTPAFADLSLDAPDKPIDEQVIVSVGGWSHHWGFSHANVTNETHNIFGVEYNSYSAGYFKNSYGKDTFFIAKTWRKEFFENIEGSVSLGINYGYTRCYGEDDSGKNICAHGWLGLSYTKHMVVPSLKVQPGVIVFSPEIRF